MSTYRELVAAAIPSREAADLTGVSRASANYTPRAGVQLARVVPVNKLSAAERAHVLAVMDSDRFVDLAPLQIYGQLLDEGTYLCSVSTFYRVLAEHKQVKERRRLARHPARVRPELVAAGPGQVFSWDITKLAGPVKGRYYDAYVMIDGVGGEAWSRPAVDVGHRHLRPRGWGSFASRPPAPPTAYRPAPGGPAVR